MIYKIERIYQKGSRDINEDAYVMNKEDGIFAVIDGATGVGGLSGIIASNIIRDAMLREDGNLLERVLKGNVILGEKAVVTLGEAGIKKIGDIPKYKRSSCSLAAIQLPLSGLKMKYVTAGDCLLFIQYKNNEIRQVNHDHVAPLDSFGIHLAQTEWRKYVSENEDPNKWGLYEINQTTKAILEAVHDTLQQNRNKMNTSEGYGIIDGSEEVDEFLESGVIPLINVKKILLLSDGLRVHSNRNQVIENEWLYSAKLAFEHGLSYLEKTIMDIEINDLACYQYPRFKQHDDKTGLLIHLG
ncbi:hypothetical protein [Neobacillus sp. PS3-40]|uniref:hypothetical protein n=1 Tax=Neobacillus sp. PS3-40 TaxID=3070679 RepID=UPI0027DF4242|nr:hypothetical protein [Neobacillus sp. PS3-40]WML46185.1 hypothetical protein RCG20_09950 [Neobacillus sp. PS3-40]